MSLKFLMEKCSISGTERKAKEVGWKESGSNCQSCKASWRIWSGEICCLYFCGYPTCLSWSKFSLWLLTCSCYHLLTLITSSPNISFIQFPQDCLGHFNTYCFFFKLTKRECCQFIHVTAYFYLACNLILYTCFQKHMKVEDANLKRVREDLQNKVDYLRKQADVSTILVHLFNFSTVFVLSVSMALAPNICLHAVSSSIQAFCSSFPGVYFRCLNYIRNQIITQHWLFVRNFT